jgi:cellobiose-specific phosphotransferase system component IIB
MKYSSGQYYEWARKQVNEEYASAVYEKDKITFQSEGYTACMQFYPDDIVELSIVKDDSGENCFYLHFQANNEAHAEELFYALRDTLKTVVRNMKHKILISCTSALTSSYFAQELNKASSMLKLDYQFDACDHNRLYQVGFQYEAILLTPQIHYEYEKAKRIFQDQVVLKIPTRAYASYSSGEVINLLNQAFEEKEKQDSDMQYRIQPVLEGNKYRILTIGMINHRDEKRIAYRIYDHGHKTLDKEVIKADLNLRDIEDLLDYIFARHKKIDTIVLGMPGVEENGKLTWEGSKFDHASISEDLKEKYQHSFFLLNDVNAIALGYSTLHPDCSDLLFYFQPKGSWVPGAGLIEEGILRKGYHNASGELRPFMKCMITDLDDKINTPKGAMEIVVRGLLAFICTSAPKKIVLYSQLTPDAKEVREELHRYVPDEYIPSITIASHLKEYLLPGLLSYGVQKLSKNS